MHAHQKYRSRILVLACAIALFLLAGCAGLPPAPNRVASHAEPASTNTTWGRYAAGTALPAGVSGFWPLGQAEYALDARLELMRRAERSIDLQTYQIGNDGLGRLMLKELRDAARRGVRVRLLVDDFYTLGLDAALLQLSAHEGIEVRLFNPFVYGRDSANGRLWNLLTDGRRLNHRMHNKLLSVDGALAIAGGRNLSGEYFMLDPRNNFLDYEFIIAGALVPELAALFDRYWNHERVLDIQRISNDGLSGAERRAAFERVAAGAAQITPPAGPDMLGAPVLAQALRQGLAPFRHARAEAFADDPGKTFKPPTAPDTTEAHTTLAWLEARTLQAPRLSTVISPYFLPDAATRQRMREAAQRGTQITIITNSIASSDEPLVAFASHRNRHEWLAAGVRLFEMRPTSDTVTPFTRTAPAGSSLRLHTKMGIFDRRLLAIGSINVDPRSHRINTELAIVIDSPDLAGNISDGVHALLQTDVVQEVRLSDEGLRWYVRRPQGEQRHNEEPDVGVWQRLRLRLIYLLVPDELL